MGLRIRIDKSIISVPMLLKKCLHFIILWGENEIQDLFIFFTITKFRSLHWCYGWISTQKEYKTRYVYPQGNVQEIKIWPYQQVDMHNPAHVLENDTHKILWDTRITSSRPEDQTS